MLVLLVLRLQLLPQLWCFVVAIVQGRFILGDVNAFGGCGGRDGSHTIYVSLLFTLLTLPISLFK
jgi:hypothetical protein